VVIFGAILILAFIIIPKLTETKDLKVPDVYGMEISKAEQLLKDEGFKINSVEKTSDSVEEDLVIKTEPTKNRYVKEGTSITIYYSAGTTKMNVEDYTDKNVYEIKAKIELNGVKVEIEEQEVEDSTIYEGKEQLIIGQSVEPGKKLASGESITLYIPKIVTLYPDMVQDAWSLERVQEFCEKYGLRLVVNEKETDDVEENIVLAQSPKANEEIFRNETFKVVVSKKRSTTTTTTTTKKPTTTNESEEKTE
jgi:serine/threonine-protein kinase